MLTVHIRAIFSVNDWDSVVAVVHQFQRPVENQRFDWHVKSAHPSLLHFLISSVLYDCRKSTAKNHFKLFTWKKLLWKTNRKFVKWTWNFVCQLTQPYADLNKLCYVVHKMKQTIAIIQMKITAKQVYWKFQA